MRLFGAAILVAALILPASAVFARDGNHEAITQQLLDLIKAHPEIERMLKASIKAAQKINPDIASNPVQSYDKYFDYIDKASKLPPHDSPPYTRDELLQRICYFYFLVDQPLEELKPIPKLFNPALQYYEPFSNWLRDFAKTWGQFLDTTASWSEEQYQEFYKDPAYGLQKGWYEDHKNWTTFNLFFSRKLLAPYKRPVAPPIVVAPADSVPQGVWKIRADSTIEVKDGLKVKLARYFSVNDLLSKDSQYKNAFANGVLTHTFLNVFDYHRYHFSVGGKIKEMNRIAKNVALEVSWSSGDNQYIPLDSTGWQFTQTRGYVIVDTGKTYGLVALIPMGMAQVSSVNFEKNVTVGSIHLKGDPLGYFLFGGSDFIILFQKQANFEITAPEEDPRAEKAGSDKGQTVEPVLYKHIHANEEYGRMKGQTK